MPVYVYEAKHHGCATCASPGFEIEQSIQDEKLTRCPECGTEIYRVIQPVALGHSRTDLNYRAKRAGFHTYQKVQKGEYERLY